MQQRFNGLRNSNKDFPLNTSEWGKTDLSYLKNNGKCSKLKSQSSRSLKAELLILKVLVNSVASCFRWEVEWSHIFQLGRINANKVLQEVMQLIWEHCLRTRPLVGLSNLYICNISGRGHKDSLTTVQSCLERKVGKSDRVQHWPLSSSCLLEKL